MIITSLESAPSGVEMLLGSIPGYRSASTDAWRLLDGHRPDDTDRSTTIRSERSHSTHVAGDRHPSFIQTETAQTVKASAKGAACTGGVELRPNRIESGCYK